MEYLNNKKNVGHPTKLSFLAIFPDSKKHVMVLQIKPIGCLFYFFANKI